MTDPAFIALAQQARHVAAQLADAPPTGPIGLLRALADEVITRFAPPAATGHPTAALAVGDRGRVTPSGLGAQPIRVYVIEIVQHGVPLNTYEAIIGNPRRESSIIVRTMEEGDRSRQLWIAASRFVRLVT